MRVSLGTAVRKEREKWRIMEWKCSSITYPQLGEEEEIFI